MLDNLWKLIYLIPLIIWQSSALAARNDFVGTWIATTNNARYPVITIDSNFNVSIPNVTNSRLSTYGNTTTGTQSSQHKVAFTQFQHSGRSFRLMAILGGLLGNKGRDKLDSVLLENLGQSQDEGNVTHAVEYMRRIIIVDPIPRQ